MRDGSIQFSSTRSSDGGSGGGDFFLEELPSSYVINEVLIVYA
jgi:hypothetical protein